MRTNLLVPTLSFLTFVAVAACGTTEEFVPTDTSGDTDVTDTSGDTDPADTDPADTDPADTDPADTDTDPGACSEPDPSQTCLDTGCPEGQECTPAEGCVPSVCSCSDGTWECTADCGPNYECVPTTTGGCPVEEPDFTGECSEVGLYCEWGMECCCGECYGSTFCDCTESGWACGATDACFIESCAGRECADDTDCEGGGVPTYCIDGECSYADADGWSAGYLVPITEGCGGAGSDAYDLDAVELAADDLVVTVSYSGGCAEHEFRACWDGSFMESFPVQARIDLQHDGNDDPCEAYPTEERRISLVPLREAYVEGYGDGSATVIVHIGEQTVEYTF